MMFEEEPMVDERVNIRPSKVNKIQNYLRVIFNSKALPYLVVLFCVTSVSFTGVQPFAYVMLGIATLFDIPLLLPLIVSIASMLIFKTQATPIITYIIVHVIYVISTIAIPFKGMSKKLSTYIKLVSGVVLGGLISMLIYGVSLSSFLSLIMTILLITSFYPVFVTGIKMLLNIKKHIVFSREEIISLGCIFAIIFSLFNGISILNFSLAGVLSLILVVIIGWQNDWIIGTTSGVMIGLVYSIITKDTSLVITSFGLSGLISGLLSKYGKVYVAIAFCIGNVLLAYLYNTDMVMWSKLAEVLVASGVILALPKKVMLKLEDILGKSNYLNAGYENQLGPASDMRSRLGAISEVFESLSHITTPVTDKTRAETADVIKKYIEDYKKNECISCPNRFNCLDGNELYIVSTHIADRLEENKLITKEMLPVSCDLSYEMIEQIEEIYGNMKLMRVIKAKEDEIQEKLAIEYKTISELVKNMSREEKLPSKIVSNKQKRIREELEYLGYTVYEDSEEVSEDKYIYEFVTDILVDMDKAKKDIQDIVSDIAGMDMRIKLILNSSKTEKSRVKLVPSSMYTVKANVKQIKKSDSDVNGDSYVIAETKNNNKIIAISDGMGSGSKSKEVSSSVINMIQSMSNSGLSENYIIELTNRVLKQKESGGMSASLDLCMLDEMSNKFQFIKIGAALSYVIDDDMVECIKNTSDPMGLFNELPYTSYEKEAKNGMLVVMMTDGALEITPKVMEEIVAHNKGKLTPEVIMDEIMGVILGSQNKIMLDDITVIVAKVV